MSSTGAKNRLMAEYKGLQKEKWLNIELNQGGLFIWTVGLIVINPESAWDGAYFKTEMTFTDKYPYDPPTFRFIRPIYHPNVYADGKVCISILHAPGEDEQSGEMACERWSSIQGVESVLRSILLLLDSPEIGSPANVDAGVMYRDKRDEYNIKAKEAVETSKQDIPEDFVMPATLDEAPPAKMVDDDDFWAESGDDFGGSDSSEDDLGMDEDDEDGGDQEFLDGDEEAEEDEDPATDDEDPEMSD